MARGSGSGSGSVGCVCCCDGGSFSSLLPSSPFFAKRTALEEGVTDEGLRALASAGCGEKLTSLILWGECSFVLVFSFDGVWEWEWECRMCVWL